MSVEVFATKIDRTHIYFLCPFCRTSYRKDGNPRNNAKQVVHIHGSCNDLSNRIEVRVHHCDSKRYDGDFRIHITDETIRS